MADGWEAGMTLGLVGGKGDTADGLSPSLGDPDGEVEASGLTQ
jgi:hypothetical protein